MIYEETAVELTKDLVRIESFSVEGKQRILQYMYDRIKRETNANVQIYDKNTENPFLIAHYKNGDGYKLLLHGHLDTVSLEGISDPLNPIEIDGEIYGRGSCDMKSGTACHYAAFKYICDQELTGDVYLMFSTDEETYAKQTVTAFERGLLPKCYLGIITEPTNQKLITAQKGDAWIEVEFIGESAHSSTPEQGNNAIYMACEFILAYKEYTEESYKKNPHHLLGEAKMNVGLINGGVEPNSVPSSCKVVIDKRYLPNESMEQFEAEIKGVAEQLKIKDPTFNYSIKPLVDCTPMEFDSRTDKFQELKHILEEELGREIEVSVFGGWAEGGTLAKYNVDTLYFGPGNSDYAHTVNERVGIQSIQTVTKGLISIANKKLV